MNPKITERDEGGRPKAAREGNGADQPGQEQGVAAAGPPAELDGQLGPDELPAPEEVVMNKEAKLHH